MVNKKNLLGMLVMVLVFGMMIIGCKDTDAETTKIIKYQVTGVIPAGLTCKIIYDDAYTDNPGITLNNVQLPWEKTTSETRKVGSSYIVSITAGFTNKDGIWVVGTTGAYITTKIFVDGTEVRADSGPNGPQSAGTSSSAVIIW